MGCASTLKQLICYVKMNIPKSYFSGSYSQKWHSLISSSKAYKVPRVSTNCKSDNNRHITDHCNAFVSRFIARKPCLPKTDFKFCTLILDMNP